MQLYTEHQFNTLVKAYGYGEDIYGKSNGTRSQFIAEYGYAKCSICHKWGKFGHDIFMVYSPTKRLEEYFCKKDHPKID